MSKKIKSQIETSLFNEGVYPDGIIAKKDGTFVVRKSYFYTFGMTAEKWGVALALARHTIHARRVCRRCGQSCGRNGYACGSVLCGQVDVIVLGIEQEQST